MTFGILLAILTPLLPLVASLLILAAGPDRQHERATLGVLPLAGAFVCSLLILWHVASEGAVTIRFYNPASIADLALPLGFYVDRLSAVMMVLISLVATIIYRYSVNYMYQDPGYRRFLALVGFTTFVLLCMVSSSNLMMLFIFWQILSYLLYVLIHNHGHDRTLEGAFRTFAILRSGDVAFLAGIVLAYSLYGTLEFPDLFAAAVQSIVTVSPLPGIELNGATAVTLLLFIGGISKSAQFPLHIWLPKYLYAPTPVTALLHAGIINAGGFLINRLAPLFGLSPTTLHVAFVVGTLTAILGATMMLAQNDIKNMLGFSTIGQMGYMVMECGLGAFSLAVFHLVAHGLFKATVFLNCGNVIGRARQDPHFPHSAQDPGQKTNFSLTWVTGFLTTLLLPLVILLLTHGVLKIPLLESQGTVIFLFFIWITSSQAILTLTRLRFVASWKVSVAMLLTLLFVVFVYLFALESFTAFLYPDDLVVASYFKAAELPSWLFDMMVGAAALTTILGWGYLYMKAQGRSLPAPAWIESIRVRLYVLFLNRLYVDECVDRIGQALLSALHRFEERAKERTS